MIMGTLFGLLLFIFGGVALMVVLGGRYAKPMAPDKMRRISRWIIPLVAISLVVQVIYLWVNEPDSDAEVRPPAPAVFNKS